MLLGTKIRIKKGTIVIYFIFFFIYTNIYNKSEIMEDNKTPQQLYYENNKEKFSDRAKKYYEKNKEKAEKYAIDLESLNFQRKNEVKDIIDNISFDRSTYNLIDILKTSKDLMGNPFSPDTIFALETIQQQTNTILSNKVSLI